MVFILISVAWAAIVLMVVAVCRSQ